MSSKSGKMDKKGRNAVSSEVSESSQVSSKSSVSSSASVASSVVEKTTVQQRTETSSSMSNTNISSSITIGDKWFMPGFLNLKELNTLLLKYIGQVQDLELNQSKPGANNSITVNIDSTVISSLKERYEDQLNDWKKQCDDKDKLIKALKAEIEKLKAEIKKLEASNKQKDETIKERDRTIEGLRKEISDLQAKLSMYQSQKEIYEFQILRLKGEITYLTGELNAMHNAFTSEKNRSADLVSRLRSMEKELEFKMDVLEMELASERSKTSVDISSMDNRIKNEYADRLRDELKLLRNIYEEHMIKSEAELEMKYIKEISDLEVQLEVRMNSVKVNEDVSKLKIELEGYKKTIEELKAANESLNKEWSKLSVEMRDKEIKFNSEMSTKNIKMAHLARLHAEYKKSYEELRYRHLYDQSEVKVYNRLITPEYERLRSRSSVITVGSRLFSDGEAKGSSSDEESTKTINGYKTQSVMEKKVVKEVKEVKEVSESGKKK